MVSGAEIRKRERGYRRVRRERLAECGALVLALALAFIGKTIIEFSIALAAMAGLLIFAVFQLSWVLDARPVFTVIVRGVIGVMIACLLVGVYGWVGWPTAHRHTLSARERALFEAPLKAIQNPKMHIQVSCPSADEKTCTFAQQFQTFFSESGWDVDPAVQRVTLLRPMSGIVLVERGGTEESQTTKWKAGIGGWTAITPEWESIYWAFSGIGIEPDGSANYALPDGQITVYFGPERDDESRPTDVSTSIRNLRKWREEGLIPKVGEKPTPEMIEKSRKMNQ